MVKQLSIDISGAVHNPEYIGFIRAVIHRIENNIMIDRKIVRVPFLPGSFLIRLMSFRHCLKIFNRLLDPGDLSFSIIRFF